MPFPESAILPGGVPLKTNREHINDVRRDAFNNPGLIGGRLTAQSGTPVPPGNLPGVGTIYYTPYLHDRVPVWDGERWVSRVFTQRSLSLTGHDADKNYDVFLGAGLTLSSSAWTSDTARAVTLVRQEGLLVDAADPTRLFLGSFRTRADVATQTNDSSSFRQLSNMYNRVPRPLAGWPGSTVSGTLGAGAVNTELNSGYRAHWIACYTDIFLMLHFQSTYYENAVWNNRIGVSYHVSGGSGGASPIGDVDTTAGHGGQLRHSESRYVALGWDYAKIVANTEAGGGFKWRGLGFHGTTGFIIM